MTLVLCLKTWDLGQDFHSTSATNLGSAEKTQAVYGGGGHHEHQLAAFCCSFTFHNHILIWVKNCIHQKTKLLIKNALES